MPIYEYHCDQAEEGCGYLFEEIQGFNDDPLSDCPKCGQKKLKKLLGKPGAIIFKGSGFYCTDYPKADRPSTEA
jgi:putative FmdB family regulatory protein